MHLLPKLKKIKQEKGIFTVSMFDNYMEERKADMKLSDSIMSYLVDMGFDVPSRRPKFGHGVSFKASLEGKSIKIIGSYHPSQQNTFTGKLTPKMLDGIFKLAQK